MIVNRVLNKKIHTLSPDDTLSVCSLFFNNIKPLLKKMGFKSHALHAQRTSGAEMAKKKNDGPKAFKLIKNSSSSSCNKGTMTETPFCLIIFQITGHRLAAIQPILNLPERLTGYKAAHSLAATRKSVWMTRAGRCILRPYSLGVFP